MRNITAITKRELGSYFESPVAYVFMVVFLVLIGFLTFFVSRFYEAGQADLRPFFFWHPWMFLILVPAVAMRLWAEERRSGTIETLLTLPITMTQATLGKFIAAWIFLALAILLTFPIVLTTAYLGAPDRGAIMGGYLGSVLLAGAYLSVGMLTSAFTRNQVISFVLAVVICLFLLLAGWPPVTDLVARWAPDWLVQGVAAFSFMPHYEAFQKGVLDIRDFAYYFSIMIFMLFGTNLVLENRKSA
ncbi:MAG: ABC transporter permease [Verrucomicrobia bacterium]|nr:ABC transporter permease [Verrucomicrobiota bacterium]MBU4247409.1 ABC transporter permease [Verrucomicrobiota bacterium]MBU4290947.1 ABC transporter permease [Verrucomicrobiota bacterium]MBU4497792.1 ABC transporter permease [Verrucomicrobiota bacterium]MCG2681669.1 ABC transporter permease [Kiritimatiellia bacterium]